MVMASEEENVMHHTDSDYPARGFSIVQPTFMEMQLTGWLGTAQFSRLGHRYAIKFVNFRTPQCLRDEKPIAWHKMNARALEVANKAADFLNMAAKMMR